MVSLFRRYFPFQRFTVMLTVGQKFVKKSHPLNPNPPICFLPAQKNKATSYHLGQLKAKLAKLRRELISTPAAGGGGGGGGIGFDVARYDLWTSHSFMINPEFAELVL